MGFHDLSLLIYFNAIGIYLNIYMAYSYPFEGMITMPIVTIIVCYIRRCVQAGTVAAKTVTDR